MSAAAMASPPSPVRMSSGACRRFDAARVLLAVFGFIHFLPVPRVTRGLADDDYLALSRKTHPDRAKNSGRWLAIAQDGVPLAFRASDSERVEHDGEDAAGADDEHDTRHHGAGSRIADRRRAV